MDQYIHDFYKQYQDDTATGRFHEVILLQQDNKYPWEQLQVKCPDLCRGWFELASLSKEDRIEFTKEFWISKLPFQPGMAGYLDTFFSRIEDIYVYIVQSKFDDPIEAHLVYSLKGGNGFFRGNSPAKESDLTALKAHFNKCIFPEEYLAFLQIHNGFSKTTDSGILSAAEVENNFIFLQGLIGSKETVLKSGDKNVDPLNLIPFYKSFNLPFFQCFYTEWFPRDEMGNVYYSSDANIISDLSQRASADNMAFTTFSRWLVFYLEAIQ